MSARAAAAAAGPAAGAAAAGAGRMWAMSAHVYGSAAELRVLAARRPVLRAPDQLLVRVRAASVNPLDAAMLGGYGSVVLNALRRAEGWARGEGGAGDGDEFPLVLGRDFVGTVEAAGSAARTAPGAAVWGVLPPHVAGAHRQYVAVSERWTGPAPARLGLAAGGALFAGLSAWAALRAARLTPGAGAGGRGGGARVLQLGLGGVGSLALQLLAHAGHHVTVGCAEESAAAAERWGAARVLARDRPDYAQHVHAAGPFDVVLDFAGVGGEAALRTAGGGAGCVVTLSSPLLREMDARGLLLGGCAAVARLAAANVSTGAAGGAGGARRALPVRWAYFSPDADGIRALGRLAERGQLEVPVWRQLPWWQAPTALALQAAGHARGKLLLDFTPPLPADYHPHHGRDDQCARTG